MRRFKLFRSRFTQMTFAVALASVLGGFGSKPALAEENGTIDTSTPNTMEQTIDTNELELQMQEENLNDTTLAEENIPSDTVETYVEENIPSDTVETYVEENIPSDTATVDVVPIEQEIVETPSEPEYTTYVADNNVNVVGDVNPNDLQQLDETVNDIYEGTGNDVYIENTTLEEGSNEIQTNGINEGVIANVDEENNVTLEGDKVTEMNQLNQDFEVKEVTNTSENQTEISENDNKTEYTIEEETPELINELTKTTNENKEIDTSQDTVVTDSTNSLKETSDFELKRNEYAVVKDANGNYTLVFGEELPNAVDVVKLTNELKKNNKELANVSFTYDKVANIDMSDKEIVLKDSKSELGAKEYMVIKDKDGTYKIIIDGNHLTNQDIVNIKEQIKELHPEIDVDDIEVKSSKDVNLNEADIIDGGYARGNKPVPDEPTPPTPEPPTPEPPTPDKPTPEPPTPDKPNKSTPDKPTPNKSTPDKPTPNKSTPDNPTPVTPQTPKTNPKATPKTGDNTIETLKAKISLGVGLGLFASGVVLRKRREDGEAIYGIVDKDTYNMVMNKNKRIKGLSR